MAKAAKASGPSIINIAYPRQDEVIVHLVGVTWLYHHQPSFDARMSLLIPSGRKNEAERAASMKHDPIKEYVESTYRTEDDKAPTRLLMLASALKKSLITAAGDMPGVYKTDVGRLIWVLSATDKKFLPVWGIPKLGMDYVRMADRARTPDIRTRAVCVEWATRATIRYHASRFNATTMVNLCANAGVYCGWGDYRQEKGSGDGGLWRVANEEDPEWQAITKTQGRAAQDHALENPEFLDADTERQFAAYAQEVQRRGHREAKGPIQIRHEGENAQLAETYGGNGRGTPDAASIAAATRRRKQRRAEARA